MTLLDRFRALGEFLSGITERWVPDSWVVCMMLTTIALALAIFGAGAGVEEAILGGGAGVWDLLELAMQFTIALVAAHACIASPRVFGWLDRLASLPRPGRPVQVVLLTAVFSLVTAYLNWALCLVACALFVPFVLRRNPDTDVRLVMAAAYLGLGTVWHCGLSGSAPLILATPGNPLLAPATGPAIVDRIYPVTETLFHPFNLGYMVVIGAVGLVALALLYPRRRTVTMPREKIEAILPRPPDPPGPPGSPAARLDAFRGWTVLAVILLGYPLGYAIVTRGFGSSWTINAYNTTFLVIALVLQGHPISFLRACRRGLDAAWGIVLQFPFYAGIFGLMRHTSLGIWLGALFADLATTTTYPFVVYVYSAMMNLFIPSAGSKWLIEAPFLIPAGETLGVSVQTILLAYAYGDSTTNLIQPFFAIPLLAVTGLRFGDLLGYTMIVAAVCFVVSAGAMFLIPATL